MTNRNVNPERFKYSHELYNYLELYSDYLEKIGEESFANLMYFIQFVLLDYDNSRLIGYSLDYSRFKDRLNNGKKRR